MLVHHVMNYFPCCSNNDASTSSCSCVITNHVEKRGELEAQASSMTKGLEKRHEGKRALDNMLSVQKSPMIRVDLDSTPISSTSPRLTGKMAKNKSIIRPRLFASSAKLKGTMLGIAQ